MRERTFDDEGEKKSHEYQFPSKRERNIRKIMTERGKKFMKALKNHLAIFTAFNKNESCRVKKVGDKLKCRLKVQYS